MQIYVVGGAVRDTLLGKKVQDHDYVVVGAAPEQLLSLGFQAVGKDFPVFLHPITKEEYALARTERKTARGYHGFNFYYAPDVTLEQDLARRDLTINAMACPIQSSEEEVKKSILNAHPHTTPAPTIDLSRLVDPFGGLADLQAGVLRHVSDAFSEDPVRILRAARFAARFPKFHLAPETLTLMRDMVQAGEVDALVAERVWQEVAAGLMSEAPERLFITLHACGALDRLMPELEGLFSVTQDTPEIASSPLSALHYAAQQSYSISVRFAVVVTAVCIPYNIPSLQKKEVLAHALSAQTSTQSLPINPAPFLALCQRLKVPNACRDLALLVHREYRGLMRTLKHDSSLQACDIVVLLERCDAFRKPERLYEALQVCQAHQAVYDIQAGNLVDFPTSPSPSLHTLLLYKALHIVNRINTGAVAAQYLKQPKRIKQAIHDARIAVVQLELNIN